MHVTDRSKKNVEVGEEVHRRSFHKNFSTDARQRLIEEECGSWRRKPSKVARRKFLNRYASKIDRRRMWKLAKKSIEGRFTKIAFPTDAHQRLIEKECESWRWKPLKVTPQKFPNRYASKIDQRRMWKLAKKTIEGHSTKISQQMRVKDWSKKSVEVGDENHRRSLHKNFPTDARQRWSKKNNCLSEERLT